MAQHVAQDGSPGRPDGRLDGRPDGWPAVPGLDEALARLEGLPERPLDEHVEVVDSVQRALAQALDADGD